MPRTGFLYLFGNLAKQAEKRSTMKSGDDIFLRLKPTPFILGPLSSLPLCLRVAREGSRAL